MRNTYTAAARAAHAPGDDTLARALKEALNSRTVRGCPSGHKCIPLARPPGKHFLRTQRGSASHKKRRRRRFFPQCIVCHSKVRLTT